MIHLGSVHKSVVRICETEFVKLINLSIWIGMFEQATWRVTFSQEKEFKHQNLNKKMKHRIYSDRSGFY